MSTKVAIVTGANKGIGFEIARKLCEVGFTTILACRNRELGETAVAALGPNAIFMPLDISNDASIEAFAASLKSSFTQIDVLVNNAAIAFKGSDPTPFAMQSKPTIDVNFIGTLKVTKAVVPLLRASASPRIVNVASQAGMLKLLNNSPEKKAMFNSPSLTESELVDLMQSFVAAAEDGTHESKGWPSSNYGMSKLGVIAWTKMMARDEPTIRINAVCPGWCATDMSSQRGTRTAEEGARGAFRLATTLDEEISGKFFIDEHLIDWEGEAKWN